MLTSQWLLWIHCFTSLVRFTAPNNRANNTREHSTGCETDATCNIQQFWELCGQKCCVRWHAALLIKLKPAPQNSNENAIITDNRLKFIEAHTVIHPKREYQSTLRYQFLKFEINWTESVSSHKRRHFEKLKFLKRIDFYKHFKMIIKDNEVAWCFSDNTALNSLSHLLIERGPLLLLLYFNEDKRPLVAFVLRTAKRRRWKFPFKSKFTIFQSSSRLFQLTLSNVSDLSWSWVPKNHIQVEKERKFRPRLFASSIIHVLACENIRFSSVFAAEHVFETSSSKKNEEKRMFSQANTRMWKLGTSQSCSDVTKCTTVLFSVCRSCCWSLGPSTWIRKFLKSYILSPGFETTLERGLMKRCGFCERIHWFHRDGTSTQSCTKNKRLQLRNIRIRLDVALRSLFLSGEKLFAKKCLYIW